MLDLISRAEAVARGLKRYFTGKPCKWGHVSERILPGNTCLTCRQQYQRRHHAARYAANLNNYRERARERVRLWKIANPDKYEARLRRESDKNRKRKTQYQRQRAEDVRKAIDARQAARLRGETTYFTGLPCIHGHVAKRQFPKGSCMECARERGRRVYAENPEKRREEKRRWRDANPEKARRNNAEYMRRARAANPEKHRERARKWHAAHPERRKEYLQRRMKKIRLAFEILERFNNFETP